MSTVTPLPLVFGDYALEDRQRLDKGRVYPTGIQVLVRLPMMQRQLVETLQVAERSTQAASAVGP